MKSGVVLRRIAWNRHSDQSVKPIKQKLIKQKIRSLLLLALGLIMALVAHWPSIAVAQSTPAISDLPPRAELRGVWLTNVDSDVLFSRRNLEDGIAQLKRLNFNTVYPTVWNGGYTLYPSEVAEKSFGAAIDPIPELEGRDMLAEAIEIGHEQGLAVIPWYEFGLMAMEDSEIAQQHPEWIMARQDGSQIFVQGDRGQYHFVWLNPAHPEVQELMTDLMVEVVDKYDIDGIQFDDHFGTPVELGYDDYTVNLYKQQHNGNAPPDNPRDPDWMRWRARNVTTMMVKIFSAIKTRRPDCLISLSPNPKQFSYENYLQDWAPWVRLGFLDELIIQVYRSDINGFQAELDRPELRTIRNQVPTSIGILTGLRVLNVETALVEEKVRMTRDREFAGFSFFFYGTLNNHREPVLQSLLPQPATRPSPRRVATRS
ncbi:glycoside hydrolase family 10 protein [Egbenema bharatensis]|uniref:glycoside hydrolase family 10 protein n=1 Tax=Egbenema bharatensis TaxID=3463334 RepID=UPI003A8B29BE